MLHAHTTIKIIPHLSLVLAPYNIIKILGSRTGFLKVDGRRLLQGLFAAETSSSSRRGTISGGS